MGSIFYNPGGAWAGDFIPFYKAGTYHLFYLHDWRDPVHHGEGVAWYQVSTRDFVHFTEHGEMLPRGSREEQDLFVFTGCIIEAEGQYHIFYTGHNPHLEQRGKPQQAVMHAVSDDLLHWQKIPEHTFYAQEDIYELNDWRDPFVFWNPEAKEYWMLLATRLRTGPSRRRGCIALCSSKDLKQWQIHKPFWAPGLYYTHECPDLFKMGDWWYLVFSEFSERRVTRYRMSRTFNGPWIAPANDTFDDAIFYAAKTASDGVRRFIFGWNATREQERDYQPLQWGGTLVIHEVIQLADGTLSSQVPDSIDHVFDRPEPSEFRQGLGECIITHDSVEISATDSFGCSVAGIMPAQCKIQATVSWAEGTKGCGIMIRVSEDFEQAYYIRLEPYHNRLVFDAWPKPLEKRSLSFLPETEIPLNLTPGQAIEFKLLVDSTICEVYVANKLVMSTRLYDLKTGRWGVFVQQGTARFQNLSLYVSSREQG